jgi:SsrA-binding protein
MNYELLVCIVYFCQAKQQKMFKKSNILIRNKRATFDYEILDKFVAGIQLYGTEIKSIRDGKAGLSDTFCTFINDELWVKNMHIATYFFGSYNNHDVRRDRKLLLNKRELTKLSRATKETGNTIVPTKMFINDKGLAKLEIGIAKGKKNYDKRQSLKEKEDKRAIDREMKK